MNTPEFIKLKNENRFIRVIINKIYAYADDYYEYAILKSKAIDVQIRLSDNGYERRKLIDSKHELFMKYYHITCKADVLENRIESNGHMLMKMKLAKKRNGV